MVSKVRIRRFCDTGEGTCGVLFVNEIPVCFTLEDTATKQGPGIYRIPQGTYRLARVVSPKFGDCFTVLGVTGHSLLRIHWGNSPLDTSGCPLVGLVLDMAGPIKVYGSRLAFKDFMDRMEGVRETTITFENCL